MISERERLQIEVEVAEKKESDTYVGCRGEDLGKGEVADKGRGCREKKASEDLGREKRGVGCRGEDLGGGRLQREMRERDIGIEDAMRKRK